MASLLAMHFFDWTTNCTEIACAKRSKRDLNSDNYVAVHK